MAAQDHNGKRFRVIFTYGTRPTRFHTTALLGIERLRREAYFGWLSPLSLARLNAASYLVMANDITRIWNKLPSPGGRPCCLLSKKPLADFPLFWSVWPETIIDTTTSFVELVDLLLLPRRVLPERTLDHLYGTGFWGYFFGNWAERKRELSGIMYTCRGGFIDLAHLRDNVDNTFYYYRHLLADSRRSRRPFETVGYEGSVELLQDIPDDKRITVAQSLAYDESIWHEIETYWGRDHTSAFSPEDLVSNFLGTYVAKNAIPRINERGPLFDPVVTEILIQLLWILGPLPKDETLEALTAVEDWFNFPPPVLTIVIPDGLWGQYLQRRNFAFRPVRPWIIQGFGPCLFNEEIDIPSTDWPEQIPREMEDVHSYYVARYDIEFPRRSHPMTTDFPPASDAEPFQPDYPESLRNPDSTKFAQYIEEIQRDALRRYGESYQDPRPAIFNTPEPPD